MARNKMGYTLAELLIVTVVIGILAAIIAPKFSALRDKTYYAAMKADLKNLASQQENFYSDTYTYTSSPTDLGFVDSDGVTVIIGGVSTSGWSATATHRALAEGLGCAIYYGLATSPTAPVTPSVPGEVACETTVPSALPPPPLKVK